MYEAVKHFLENNGFVQGSGNEAFKYSNSKCTVIDCSDYYEVIDTSGHSMCSNDVNIYWLIGTLTYHGMLDKNYKQYFEPTGSFN